MDGVVQLVVDDLQTIQLGRARPALVEDIKVVAYEGSVLTIKELASITAPDPGQIIISPWDKSIIKKIAVAIADSDLQINPIIERDFIRLRVPTLTEERRSEMGKLIQMKIEAGRRMIRDVRNEVKAEVEALEGESGVSEDDIFRGKEELQKATDEAMEKLEDLGKRKNAEIRG